MSNIHRMTKELKKNISLIATLAVIVIMTVTGYYIISLKKSPYPVASFESFIYKWGVSDVLENSYSSVNGDYHYLDNRDSLIKTQVKLSVNDIIYIHNKINELGFWDLPNSIQFMYKEKSKKLTIYSDFDENLSLLDSAMKIKNVLQKAIDEAEGRYH